MKKHKIFKTLGFASLAVLMGFGATMAFAPLGVSAGQMNTSASGEKIQYAPSPLGLDPENDPVIYTTESGLEIKFSGADTSSVTQGKEFFKVSNIVSGKPYFTLGTYNGYAVNWVIIAIPPTMIESYYNTLSVWQTKTNLSVSYEDFFANTYETSSPAGAAIDNNGLLNAYTARTLGGLESLPTDANIPENCVLAISECLLGTSDWANSSTYYARYVCYTDARILRSNINTLYNNNFQSLMDSRIVVNTTFSPYSEKMFALQSGHATTFLTTNALRITGQINTPTTAQAWWLGNWYGWLDSGYQGGAYHVATSGAVGGASFWYTYQYNNRSTNTLGVRPACIIQLK